MQLTGEVCHRCADTYLDEQDEDEEGEPPVDEGKAVAMNGPEEHSVQITSMYGARTKTPMVVVQVADKKAMLWSVSDARKIAHLLLEAAESAEQDGFLVEHFTEEFALTVEQASLILMAFRDHRVKWRQSYEMD